ncbi:RWP-RK domain-containing protein [Dioscorea alata]|uniref:RWP-RK domain-containing protein n=1 Tax=Dioscorea alata TaxID=55571 RepID=A0ACB7WQ44_DIOAL|nr:RWP-RK domain-containing protein [Dioscorea alata]
MTSPIQPHLPCRLLSALFVFKNILNQELIRSVHVYKVCTEDGEEERRVEREFLFSPTSCLEIHTPSFAHQLLPGSTADITKWRHQEGDAVGLWLCILAFDAAKPSTSSPIPPILCFSRNPRLKSVQSLASDLNMVFQLRELQTRISGSSILERTFTDENVIIANSGRHHQDPISHSCFRVMQPLSKDKENGINLPGASVSMKKKRAATEHVASIALQDLEKYFNLPIAEASKKLKVGLTVLKRKCREYGILRWPHRKIKSLDTLIHSVQKLHLIKSLTPIEGWKPGLR